MASLHLVRHATSVAPTPDGPSQLDRPLTDQGREQADALVEQVRALNPHVIVSSPYRRALDTIAPTAAALDLDVEVVEDLREWESGLAPSADFALAYRDHWNEPRLRSGDGETHEDLTLRVLRTIDLLEIRAAGYRSVVASTHGTWIARALDGLGVEGIDADFWFSMPMPAVYTLSWDDPDETPEVTGPGV